MMLKRYLAVVVFLLSCSYSYCEVIVGQTPNATAAGVSWVMTNILPQQTGLTVNAVNYRYTTVKLTSDPMVVSVQNLNAQGNGYVFRSRDDWTGLPGNTITKSIPVENVPIQYWGAGEIKVEGKGEVLNPYVIYSYRYDTCMASVVTDPKCPNYKPSIPEVKYNDPLSDEYVQKALEKKLILENEEEAARNKRLLDNEKSTDKRKDIVAKTIQHSLITAEAASQAASFEALNNIPGYSLYSRALPGGVYQETIKYVSKQLPDNRNGLKMNLSQQGLHNQLVDLQYGSKTKGLQDE